MKICIASNKDGMEAWYRKNLGEGFTFTKPALHTGMVLPIVKEERPDILILHESLPNGALSDGWRTGFVWPSRKEGQE